MGPRPLVLVLDLTLGFETIMDGASLSTGTPLDGFARTDLFGGSAWTWPLGPQATTTDLGLQVLMTDPAASFGYTFSAATDLQILATNYVHVSATTGSPGNPGTAAAPVDTIAAGLGLASAGDIVLVASGTYSESPTFVDGVSVLGGYDALTWTATGGDSVITVSASGAQVSSITTPTVLRDLRFEAADARGVGEPSIALEVRASSDALLIDDCVFVAGDGTDGVSGGDGVAGLPGTNGQDGINWGQPGQGGGADNDGGMGGDEDQDGGGGGGGGGGGDLGCAGFGGFGGGGGGGGGGGTAGLGGSGGGASLAVFLYDASPRLRDCEFVAANGGDAGDGGEGAMGAAGGSGGMGEPPSGTSGPGGDGGDGHAGGDGGGGAGGAGGPSWCVYRGGSSLPEIISPVYTTGSGGLGGLGGLNGSGASTAPDGPAGPVGTVGP